MQRLYRGRVQRSRLDIISENLRKDSIMQPRITLRKAKTIVTNFINSFKEVLHKYYRYCVEPEQVRPFINTVINNMKSRYNSFLKALKRNGAWPLGLNTIELLAEQMMNRYVKKICSRSLPIV